MEMEFTRKLPTPVEIKAEFPVDEKIEKLRNDRDRELKNILSGKSDKLLLIIGPCSADNEDAVM